MGLPLFWANETARRDDSSQPQSQNRYRARMPDVPKKSFLNKNLAQIPAEGTQLNII